MSPAWIRTRRNKGGKSYQVLYRRGGREYPIETAGTAGTMRDAKLRRDIVSGWLAQGLDPKAEFAKLLTPPAPKLPLRVWAARYERSRVDAADSTARGIRSHLARLSVSPLAAMPVDAVTFADVQGLVSEWSKDLKPRTISRYLGTVQRIFDYADVTPNPARDRRVKLPSVVREEANPPTADQFVALLAVMARRYWLPLVVLEQTGMRVGEVVSLTWGDVDEAGARFRLRAASTKSRRARWVQVPAWLMEVVAGSLPREDRTDGRRVFAGFTADATRNAMGRACVIAGLPHFHPHDLRHRRGTIWHHDPAITIREQMERGGWTRSDIAIDTYSHIQALDEVPVATLRALLVMPR